MADKENKFKVLDSEIIEPQLDEESTLQGGFIDILIRFTEIKEILGFIVDYKTNSVEIEKPEKLNFDSNEMTGILNDMTSILLKNQMEIRQLRAHIHLTQQKSK